MVPKWPVPWAWIAAGAVLAAFLLGWLGAGFLARRIVAREASRLLTTRVTVDRVALQAIPPRARLEGVTIHNPPGYSEEALLTLRRVGVSFDPASVLSSTVRVTEVAVDGFELRVEKEAGDTNIQALRRRVLDSLSHEPSASRRVFISRLVVRGGRATAPAPFGLRIAVPVKDVELHGLGREGHGLAAADLAATFFDLMNPSLGAAVKRTDVGAALKGLFK